MKNRSFFFALMILVISLFSVSLQANDIQVEWVKQYPCGTSGYAADVVETAGGFVVTGGGVAIATDADGNLVSTTTLNLPAIYEYSTSSCKTDDGYLQGGNVQYVENGTVYQWIAKYNLSGNQLWSNVYNSGYCRHLAIEPNGMILGAAEGYGSNSGYLIRVNQSGGLIQYTGTSSGYGYYAINTLDGRYVMTGNKWDNGSQDWYLSGAKIDPNGSIIWAKAYTEASSGDVVKELADGNLVFGGTAGNDFYIIKTDAEGEKIWSFLIKASQIATWMGDIVPTSDESFVFAGSVSNDLTDRDVYIAKVNRFGNITGYADVNIPGNDWAKKVIQTSDGGFVTSAARNDAGELLLIKFIVVSSDVPMFNEIPESIKFNYPLGSQKELSSEIEIHNAGAGTLNWQAQEDCPWLTVNPTSGSSVGETDILLVEADANGLSEGMYETQIVLADPASGNGPVAITVRLNVYDANNMRVPSMFFTIQEAVDCAASGSTIVLEPGIFQGAGNTNVTVDKAIRIRSTDPNNPNIVDGTVIDCQNQYVSGIMSHDANASVEGISILNSKNAGTSVNIIEKCRFAGNFYGVFLNPQRRADSYKVRIENCRFYENRQGVEIYAAPTLYDAEIKDCQIERNSEGGLYFKGAGGAPGPTAQFKMTDCNVISNGRIGIYVSAIFGDVEIDGCRLTGNKAGAIYLFYLQNVKIANCIIAGNQVTSEAYFGDKSGGISAGMREGSFVINNCTIIKNRSKYGAGDINIADVCSVLLENSIIESEEELPLNLRSAAADVRFCNIKGGKDVIVPGPNTVLAWGPGNIDCDSLFVDAGYWDANSTPADVNDDFWVDGDYHLKSEGWRWDTDANQWTWDDVTSRCIDAGNPSSPLGDEPLTLEVDPLNRWGENIRINMGAYGGTAQASMGPPGWNLLCDATNDGIINFADYAVMAEEWAMADVNGLSADFSRDGEVGINDAFELAEQWLELAMWR
jgi:hypothetical protein